MFSHLGLTVGPGFVTMKPKQKPKISRFANDKESCAVKKTNPASITGVLVERIPMYFFSKILRKDQCKSTLVKTCEDICQRNMLKKKVKIVAVYQRFCPAFGFSLAKEYLFYKKLVTKTTEI